jgi:CubicO group peptidase (beta-lactamase class C family)
MIEHPSPWIEDIERNGDANAWRAGNGLVAAFRGLPIRYRSQWYVLEGEAPLLFGYGIHGQFLFVDRANGIVVAQLSSQAAPVDPARIGLIVRAVSQISKCLA